MLPSSSAAVARGATYRDGGGDIGEHDNETSRLLLLQHRNNDGNETETTGGRGKGASSPTTTPPTPPTPRRRSATAAAKAAAALLLLAVLAGAAVATAALASLVFSPSSSGTSSSSSSTGGSMSLRSRQRQQQQPRSSSSIDVPILGMSEGGDGGVDAPPGRARATRRCDSVVELFTDKYAGKSDDELRTQYAVQSQDANVFYRATANVFWIDFVENGWHDRLKFDNLGIDARQFDGTPLQRQSTWTWVTGDQHLSNFGAWHNRGGKLVFSVNDFDEAAIFDFQLDVLRIAVSVCGHAYANGLSEQDIRNTLKAFTDVYVETLVNYVGGDRELLFELTPETAYGSLKGFLSDVQNRKSSSKQMEKFTELDEHGNRRFIKGEDVDDGDAVSTRLVEVDSEIEKQIRRQFTRLQYGATMMKMGWHVRSWDDDYFTVLDVAARVGTGVGSYGVDRYYVLLKGEDGLLAGDGSNGFDDLDGTAVILDVKYEPTPALQAVLTDDQRAWYDVLFANDAQRAVEAQRRLTSYVDPFTGWIVLDGKAFVVRQRSPWKASPDLGLLTDPDDFIDFMEQVAIATATSHARGTVSKSPGQFKHVIASALGHWADRQVWGRAVAEAAMEYREQVVMDFECFREYVDANYPPLS